MSVDSYLEELEKQKKEMEKALDQKIKETYKPYIKPSYLIRLKNEVSKTQDFLEMVHIPYQISTRESPNFLLAVNDLCTDLAFINWFQCIGLSNEEKNKKYGTKEYDNKLKSRALLQISIKQVLKMSENDLFFAHTPIMFFLHAVINDLYDFLIKVDVKKYESAPNFYLKWVMLEKIVRSTRSSILLAETRDYAGSYAIIRSMIENAFIYFVIGDNEIIGNEYSTFIFYKEYYDEHGEHHPDFLALTRELKIKNMAPFSNYGWLRVLDPNKKFNYRIDEIFTYSNFPKETQKNWLNLYHECGKYVHGNYTSWGSDEYNIPFVGYVAGSIILLMSDEIDKIFNHTPIYGNVNLYAKLYNALEECRAIFEIANKK